MFGLGRNEIAGISLQEVRTFVEQGKWPKSEALKWILIGTTWEQKTFCYCPEFGCRYELIGNDCFLEDTDLVRYCCGRCGTISEWLFDAPAPLLISTYRLRALRSDEV